MKHYTVSGRALTDSRLLRFPAALFPQLMQKMPDLTQRLVNLMSDRIREATRVEQQRDRLAGLGKLSAGLAHELNNPASAAKRAASQLRTTLKRIRDASHELGARDLSPAQKAEIEKLETSLILQDGPPPDTLSISMLEEEIDSLLRSHGQDDLWQLASDLAHKNVQPETLEPLFATLDADTARAALVRIAASVEIANLLNEIESSTARISDLVRAIKEYTYMDQAPVQNVDIVKSLETTLTILNHKLKRGVAVQRDYQRVPFLVNSFGSELNQVWTNIIDNAIGAMGGKGELRVRTYPRGQLRCRGDRRQRPGNLSQQSCRTSLSRFLRPKLLAKAPGSAWTPLSGSCGNIGARFRSTQNPVTRAFRCGSRWRKLRQTRFFRALDFPRWTRALWCLAFPLVLARACSDFRVAKA